jgi:hypothetical protein
MNLRDDQHDALDDLLKQHLSNRLDPQLGKAAARFAGQAMRDSNLAQTRAVSAEAHRRWWQPILSVGAIAAAILVAYSLISYRITHQPIVPNGDHRQMVSATHPVEQAEVPLERTAYWRTYDEGTVFVDDDTPARQLRMQLVEEVSWTDRKSGQRQTSVSVPKEEVMLVAYDKY